VTPSTSVSEGLDPSIDQVLAAHRWLRIFVSNALVDHGHKQASFHLHIFSSSAISKPTPGGLPA
jgi:hypothetical protein